MVGMFFKNLFRLIWQGIIVDIAATIIAIIIGSIFDIHAVLYWYLAGAILGAVGGFFLCILLIDKAMENDCINYSHEKPHWHKVVLPMLIFGLISIAAVICLIVFWGVLTLNMKGDYSYTEFFACLSTLLGVFTVFPIEFVILIKLFGYDLQTCTHCGHVFCIEKNKTGSYSKDSIQFKTDTNRERIGSIEANGVDVADIYGDVKTDYYRKVTETNTTYDCKCLVCGKEWSGTERSRTKGAWK